MPRSWRRRARFCVDAAYGDSGNIKSFRSSAWITVFLIDAKDGCERRWMRYSPDVNGRLACEARIAGELVALKVVRSQRMFLQDSWPCHVGGIRLSSTLALTTVSQRFNGLKPPTPFQDARLKGWRQRRRSVPDTATNQSGQMFLSKALATLRDELSV